MNYILILRGERAPKKRNFLVKVFQKVSKNAFFGLFFQNFACGAENLAKTGTKLCLGRARKINSVDLKKRSTKLLKIRFKVHIMLISLVFVFLSTAISCIPIDWLYLSSFDPNREANPHPQLTPFYNQYN